MNGSENQVKWAEDIKAEVIKKVLAHRDYCQNRYEQKGIAADDPRWENIAKANAAIVYLDEHEEAKWWINNLKNFGKTVDLPNFPADLKGEGMRIVDLVDVLAYSEARKAR